VSIIDRARPELLGLAAYRSARGQQTARGILLDANENPWSPLDDDRWRINRYPEPQPDALKARMGAYYGLADENILITRGSDEAIDLLLRAFCRAGTHGIIHCPPCFAMYATAARIQGAHISRIDLDEQFQLDPDRLLAAVDDDLRLVFLCSPNNPTGSVIPVATVAKLCSELSARALLVLDEAYIEFAAVPSAIDLLARHQNLALLRTLSKAHGLAGARCGALLAAAPIINLLRRIMPPYPLPTATAVSAELILQERGLEQMRARVQKIIGQRDRMQAQLAGYPFVKRVWPSQANFVLARVDQAQALHQYLAEADIYTRWFGDEARLRECLRISVGTAQEMDALFKALDAWP